MGIFPSYDIAYVLFQVSMMTAMTRRCTLVLWEQGEAFAGLEAHRICLMRLDDKESLKQARLDISFPGVKG